MRSQSQMAELNGFCMWWMLALRAAGVPVKDNIAGVAMGLVKEGDAIKCLQIF